MNTKEKIHSILALTFLPHNLSIDEETALHADHAETKKTGGGHFKITVVSDEFTGQTLVKRHRMIYAALKKEFKGEVHALGIKAYTPGEWLRLAHS